MKIISCVICTLIFTSFIITEFTDNVSAQIKEEWVVRYNGPGNYKDAGLAIATDSNGTIYITGSSHGIGTDWDYVTIAYDLEGNELWVSRYNGPGNGADVPHDITIDLFGNIYITGYSYGGMGTIDDFATIAYDPSGNELWVSRYNGPANGVDSAHAIGCDLEGSIYVTGLSHGETYGGDYATIKYDSKGNEIWVRRYDESYGDSDTPSAMTIDTYGNVYVTGWSYGPGIGCDYATVAYDSQGNELWVARYDGPGKWLDYAHAITNDQYGNVYVTGRSFGSSYGSGTGHDYATVAYDSNGNTGWVRRYNGPGNYDDGAVDIITDSFGNIYITGYSDGEDHSSDFATIKYDSYGNELWITRYSNFIFSSDRAKAITIDASGNIYVTGHSDSDYCTIAYNSSGHELWVKSYNGPANRLDMTYGIITDTNGNVYVTGYSINSDLSNDIVTIKYSLKPKLHAKIDIIPRILNLKSQGKWITTFIELPRDYDVSNININSVMLNDAILADWSIVQNNKLMVKFDRSDVQDLLPVGTYNLMVTGELADGTSFEGYSDEIRVIDPP